MKKIGRVVTWLLVIIIIIMIAQCAGRFGHPTFKAGWQKPHSAVADGFAISHANQDTIKAIGRDLQGRPQQIYNGGGKTIIRETIREIPASRDQSYSAPAQPIIEQPQRATPQTGTITPGSNNPGPQDLLFCIDLEPAKSGDTSKKFLFWELINGLGYNISNVVANFTGRSANMLLAPGMSVDGILYNGEMLRMSVSSVSSWYAQIMGIPMPDNFRPAIRSNKSGWSSRLMTRSGDYFVYRF
ncbi:MAG TPA: hypothetical protein PKL05_00070 [bacterium]|jgi:hypothetical protein|nr:hypothetical protein [bacterium]